MCRQAGRRDGEKRARSVAYLTASRVKRGHKTRLRLNKIPSSSVRVASTVRRNEQTSTDVPFYALPLLFSPISRTYSPADSDERTRGPSSRSFQQLTSLFHVSLATRWLARCVERTPLPRIDRENETKLNWLQRRKRSVWIVVVGRSGRKSAVRSSRYRRTDGDRG